MSKLTDTRFCLNAELGGEAVNVEGGLPRVVFNAKILDSECDASLDLPEQPGSVLRLASKPTSPSSTTSAEFNETVEAEKSWGGASVVVSKEVDVMQAQELIQVESPGGLPVSSPKLDNPVGLEAEPRDDTLGAEIMDKELAYPEAEAVFDEESGPPKPRITGSTSNLEFCEMDRSTFFQKALDSSLTDPRDKAIQCEEHSRSDLVAISSQFNPDVVLAVPGVKWGSVANTERIEHACQQPKPQGNETGICSDKNRSSNAVVYPASLESVSVAPSPLEDREAIIDDKDDPRHAISNTETTRESLGYSRSMHYTNNRRAEDSRERPELPPNIYSQPPQNRLPQSFRPSCFAHRPNFSHNSVQRQPFRRDGQHGPTPMDHAPNHRHQWEGSSSSLHVGREGLAEHKFDRLPPSRQIQNMRDQGYYQTRRRKDPRNGTNFSPRPRHPYNPISRSNPPHKSNDAAFSNLDYQPRTRLRPYEGTYRAVRNNHQGSHFHHERSLQHPYSAERPRWNRHPMQSESPMRGERVANFRHRSYGASSRNTYKASSSHSYRERFYGYSPSRDKQQRFAQKPSRRDYDDDDRLRDANMQSVTTTTSTPPNACPLSLRVDVPNDESTFFNRNQLPPSISHSGSTELAPVTALPSDPGYDRSAISMASDPHNAPPISPILESGSPCPHSQFAQIDSSADDVKTSIESENRKRDQSQLDPAADVAAEVDPRTSKTSTTESDQPWKAKPQVSWRDTLPSKAEVDEGRQAQARLLKSIKEEQAREVAEASLHPRWSFVAPLSPASFKSAPRKSRTAALELIKPRVWTSDRATLFSVFPSLTKAYNGVLPGSHTDLESTSALMVLDRGDDISHCVGRKGKVRQTSSGMWEGDGWNGENELTISMTRQFQCPANDVHIHKKLRLDLKVDTNAGGLEHEVLESPVICETEQTGVPRSMPQNQFQSSDPRSKSILCQCEHFRGRNNCLECNGFALKRIPHPLPPEIESLSNVKTPTLLILSRSSPFWPTNWDEHVEEAVQFVWLGLWHIISVQDAFHDAFFEVDADSNSPRVIGQVRWTFRLQWVRGGERFYPDKTAISDPWWCPSGTKPPRASHAISEGPLQDNAPIPVYEQSCFLPTGLLTAFNGSHLGFPSAWWCIGCGMVNAQVFLRHRRCSHCNFESSSPFAIPLYCARDTFQTSAHLYPSSRIPPNAAVERYVTTWEDGTCTFQYNIRESVIFKHVFTGNREELQVASGQLWEAIQLGVELRKETSGPYFVYRTGEADESRVPTSISQAKEFMSHILKYYAELEGARVVDLMALAWLTQGTKRGMILDTRFRPAILLCLGSEVSLSLWPSSGFGIWPKEEPFDEEIITDTKMNLIDVDHIESVLRPRKKPKLTSASKQDQDPLFITLVHGDALVISGDEVEFCIKRTGMSILLIASSVGDGRMS